MEKSLYGLPKRLSLDATSTVYLVRDPEATANHGVLNLGGGPFDGVSSGKFSSSASGTVLALNAPSGYAGNLVDAQVAGASVLALSAAGNVSLNQSGRTIVYSGSGMDFSWANNVTGGSALFGIRPVTGTGVMGASVGTQTFLSVEPNVQQTSTAGYTGLSVNATELSIGSGANKLLDLAVGGISKCAVSRTGTLTAGANAAPFPLTNSTALASGNVTMTTANNFYDGPTVSCVAGTWLLIACCTVSSPANTAMRVTGKIWDGTTVVTSGEQALPALGAGVTGTTSITLAGTVSPVSTTVYKMSVTSTTASCTLRSSATDNTAGNNASWISAIRIA